jgi:uncharacterized Tic20 family protein
VHFGAAAGAFISFGALAFVAPLVAWMAKGGQSALVRSHARAALNFFAPVSAVAIGLAVLRGCLGVMPDGGLAAGALSTLIWLAGAAVWLTATIFGVVGGLRANEGREFRYPLSYPIVK